LRKFHYPQPDFSFIYRRLSENEIFFSKIKEGENYNHRNTLEYFEDYNLSLTQRLGKIAILGQPPREILKGNHIGKINFPPAYIMTGGIFSSLNG